jgi:hypothetical protein
MATTIKRDVMRNNIILVIVITISMLHCVNTQANTVAPLNTAAVAGDSATISCVSDNSTRLYWFFSSTAGEPLLMIVSGCQLNPDFADKYELVNVGAGQCDLYIRNTTTSDAGTYVCVGEYQRVMSAQLAVIVSPPKCSVSLDQEPVLARENVTYTCSVTYTSNVSPMLMTWTDSEGQPVARSYETFVAGHTTSSIVVSATAPTTPSYSCSTQFSQPAGLPSTATNTPSYQHVWTSKELSVKAGAIAPRNTAAVAGKSVVLECRQRSQNIAWIFNSAHNYAQTILAVGCASF